MVTNEERNAILEEAEDAMLIVFAAMNRAYLFTSGFDSRIIEARDAIRALKRTDAGKDDPFIRETLDAINTPEAQRKIHGGGG